MTTTAVTVALTLTGVVVVAPAASAAAPEPRTPSFGRAIDPLAAYDPQRTCSPTAKPGTSAFVKLIRDTYGSSQTLYIARSCSTGGTSEHKEGRAFDWMRSSRVVSQRDQVDALVTWLMRTDQYGNRYAMLRRLGVMYMIWKSRMWRAYDPGRGWTDYKSCTTRYTSSSYDNMCHRNHIHVSLSWPGARAQTSWYTGASQPAACTSTGTAQPPTLPTAPTGYVPLRQTRVINTVTGDGAGGLPCRLEAQHTSVFQVTGLGGVPAAGVSAVAVKVRVHEPSSATRLRVFPAGAANPAGYTASAPAGRSRVAATVVPVSQEGKIAATVSSGTSHFSLDVLGYYPTFGGVPYRAALQQRVVKQTLGPQQTVTVALGGLAGIPRAAVSGVVLGGHVWTPPESGGLAAWSAAPSAVAPNVPAVPFTKGRSASGRLVVPSTSDGKIKIQNRSAGSVRMSLDTVGWFGSGVSYRATRASTVMDTSTDVGVRGAFTAGRTAALALGGTAVPANAHAVVLQVGAVGPTADTRISAWQSGQTFPGTGQFYPRAGETTAEVVVVPLGADGKVLFSNRSGTVHLHADLLGYYA